MNAKNSKANGKPADAVPAGESNDTAGVFSPPMTATSPEAVPAALAPVTSDEPAKSAETRFVITESGATYGTDDPHAAYLASIREGAKVTERGGPYKPKF